MPDVCHAPLGPMRLGGTCDQCGHPAPAHANDEQPCVMCWIEERVEYIKRWTKEQQR